MPVLGLGVYRNDECKPACAAALNYGYRYVFRTCFMMRKGTRLCTGISTLPACTVTRLKSEKPFVRAVCPATRFSSVSIAYPFIKIVAEAYGSVEDREQ